MTTKQTPGRSSPPLRVPGFVRQRGEELSCVAQRHPLTLLFPGLLTVLLWLLPYLAFLLVGVSLWFSLSFLVAGGIGLYVSYRAFYSWQSSYYIVTSLRVVVINQENFFNRSVSEAELENILTIRYDVPGMLRSIFNFGTVTIQASGVKEEGDVVLLDIPDPYYYQEKIAQAQSATS